MFLSNELKNILTRLIAENALLTFVEPHFTGGDAMITITTEKAVVYQQKAHRYESDIEALDDFIVIHWAIEKGERA